MCHGDLIGSDTASEDLKALRKCPYFFLRPVVRGSEVLDAEKVETI